MDPQTIEEIEQVDRRISFLSATLCKFSSENNTKTENEPLHLPQLHKKTESEIKEQWTLLRVLLQGKPRPWYYHRLPRELLREIFKWINHPGDQLNLRRAFPGVADLMKWDSVDLLYFKRIYPLMQDYLWTDWRDVWRLCQVSPEFMDVVLHHFEISLSDNPTLVREIKYDFMGCPKKILAKITELADECDALGRKDWMTDMPFLVYFDFYCSTLDESVEYLTKFLDAHGQKVWTCHIYLWTGGDDDGSPDLTGFLSRILKRTPNLVNFQFLFDNSYNNAVLGAPDSLPYLQRLRSLHVAYLVSEPFIQKHAAQLKTLSVHGFSPVFQNASFRNLWFYASLNSRELEVVVPVPNIIPDSIRASPLQTVWLLISQEDNGEVNPKLPAALISLSHFEDTLKNLILEFDMDYMRNSIVAGDQWMRRVRLPKVRRLKLIEYQGKLDWLVALPSVHTLELEEYNRRAKADVGERSPDLIHISTNRITRFHTNIWTQLPNLRQLNIQNKWSLLKSSFRVTREEHEAYENGSRSQKRLITILAVLREIRAFLEPELSQADLNVFFTFGIFMVLLVLWIHVYEYFTRNVQCFSLGFIS